MKASITVMTNEATWEEELKVDSSKKRISVTLPNSLLEQVPMFLFDNPAIEVSFWRSGKQVFGTSIVSPALGIVKWLISAKLAKKIFHRRVGRIIGNM